MFYLMMSRKYANIRTFSAEDGTGSGGAGDEGANAGAGDDANKGADEAAKGEADAQKAADEAQKAADAAKNDPTKTDAEKAALLREVMEKKNALKDAQAKLKEYEGVDVAKYRQMLQAETEAAQRDAEAKGDFERVKQMMADTHKTEVSAKDARIAELEAELARRDGTIDELSIGNAFGSSAYISSELILTPTKTRVLYGGHFEVQEGAVVAFDKPKGARERTMLVDAAGQPLPFDAALRKIIDADPEKPSVTRSKAKPGAGSNTDPGIKTPNKGPELKGIAAIRARLADYKPQN